MTYREGTQRGVTRREKPQKQGFIDRETGTDTEKGQIRREDRHGEGIDTEKGQTRKKDYILREKKTYIRDRQQLK